MMMMSWSWENEKNWRCWPIIYFPVRSFIHSFSIRPISCHCGDDVDDVSCVCLNTHRFGCCNQGIALTVKRKMSKIRLGKHDDNDVEWKFIENTIVFFLSCGFPPSSRHSLHSANVQAKKQFNEMKKKIRLFWHSDKRKIVVVRSTNIH